MRLEDRSMRPPDLDTRADKASAPGVLPAPSIFGPCNAESPDQLMVRV